MSEKRWPIIELIPNTIQGEGKDAGLPCAFARFGGCDYQKCSWCDTPYAVEPAQVRANSTRMTAQEILDGLREMSAPAPLAPLIVLSGGNPALHELGPLVELLQENGHRVSVETQGSRWKQWLADVNLLTISPKPPSSGMVSEKHDQETAEFMAHVKMALARPPMAVLKIVVFDEIDYRWASAFAKRYPYELYLSAGTPQGLDAAPTVDEILSVYGWLCRRVANDPAMKHARVLPQMHVLAFGTVRGV